MLLHPRANTADDTMADRMEIDSRPEPQSEPEPLFHRVQFTVIPSASLSKEFEDQIIKQVESHGGLHVPLNPDTGRIDELDLCSHIITSTTDFPEYPRALELLISVVRPSWVMSAIDKGKMPNPRQHSPDPNLFLSGVIITCAGIPEGDKEAIIGGVLAMGGQYSGPLSKFITHVVALTVEEEKCQVALKKNLKCKIVLPHWFDDCLKLGKKIDEAPYTLPDPAILEVSSPRGHMKIPTNDHIKGALTSTPSFGALENGTRILNVFKGKKIKFSKDLPLSSRLEVILHELVRNGGGDVVDDIDSVDAYVCQYREGEDYMTAAKADKYVGNMGWLFHIITFDAWTSPMRRLLHYPLPRGGVEGFAGTCISVSNYLGEARVYLENLVIACGGVFSKNMKQDNTHLICAHTEGEKYEAAKEWNINVVNHIWLEESYANCKLQSLTNPKYTYFPPHTNLGEVIGQTQINRDAIAAKYLAESSPKKLQHKSLPIKGKPQPDMASDGPEPKSSNQSEIQVPTTIRRTKSAAFHQTPAVSRFTSDKENQTPLSTGSRGAKQRAISKLHDAADDMARYQKEVKRKGGVEHGRERESKRSSLDPANDMDVDGEQKEPGRPSKRTRTTEPEVEDDNEDSTANDTVVQNTKKGRGGKFPPIEQRMVLTKYQKWVDKPTSEQGDKNTLRNLGVLITENPTEATILCAPGIVRTRKFVCALASAPRAVSTEWLDYAISHKELPGLDEYPLVDLSSEEKYELSLEKSLKRAKGNNKHLLRGYQIFCTEGVQGGFETYKDIIEANGGTCMMYKGRNMKLTKRSFDSKKGVDAEETIRPSQGGDDGNTLYMISGDKPSEKTQWPKFREMAAKADMTPKVVMADWILFVAMSQEVRWEEKWEWTKE
ncbi:hypothetical protein K402DRAFT_350247, partial [Aulographum hederae CBS 113979]